jgi:hypothetical protein
MPYSVLKIPVDSAGHHFRLPKHSRHLFALSHISTGWLVNSYPFAAVFPEPIDLPFSKSLHHIFLHSTVVIPSRFLADATT